MNRDARARRVAAVVRDARVAELGLVLAEGDAGDVAAVVLVREGAEGAPAAADVKKAILGLKAELLGGISNGFMGTRWDKPSRKRR